MKTYDKVTKTANAEGDVVVASGWLDRVGLDNVWFTAPARRGSSVRFGAEALAALLFEGAAQSIFEICGTEKPAALVPSLMRYVA